MRFGGKILGTNANSVGRKLAHESLYWVIIFNFFVAFFRMCSQNHWHLLKNACGCVGDKIINLTVNRLLILWH